MTAPELTPQQRGRRLLVLWAYTLVGLVAFAMILFLSDGSWWVLLIPVVTLFVLGFRGLETMLGVELRRRH